MRLVDLEVLRSISYVAAAIGVCIAAGYYILNLRYTQRNMKTQLENMKATLETRQAQLFMQSYDNYNKDEFWNHYLNVMYHQEWTNGDDFWNKYGPTNPEANASRTVVLAFDR